jgi:hypothetical protein
MKIAPIYRGIAPVLIGLYGCGSEPAFNTEQKGDLNKTKSTSDALSNDSLGEIVSDPPEAEGLWDSFCKDLEADCPYGLVKKQFTQQQPQLKELDIVVIVDNSGSMKEEQVNLAPKLGALMDSIHHTNWQLGLNTTDFKDRGTLKLHLSKQDQSQSQAEKNMAFHNAVEQLGIRGSGNEMGIFMAADALSQSWVRESSYFAVLIVSDENNCSNGTGCSPASYNSHHYLADQINQLGRTLGDTAKVYSLHKRTAQECSQAPFVGHEYNAIVALSNGIAGAICDEDYTNVLQAMSADMAVTMDLAFALGVEVVADSVRVWIDGVFITSGYIVKDNTLIFSADAAPTPGATIEVKFLTTNTLKQ